MLAEKQARLEKNRKKKEKQKAKKAEAKAAAQEEEEQLKEEAQRKEADQIAAARAARMPAPMLQGVDFKSMFKPKEKGAPDAKAPDNHADNPVQVS